MCNVVKPVISAEAATFIEALRKANVSNAGIIRVVQELTTIPFDSMIAALINGYTTDDSADLDASLRRAATGGEDRKKRCYSCEKVLIGRGEMCESCEFAEMAERRYSRLSNRIRPASRQSPYVSQL